jgi:membrane AbrB-like protein
VHQAEPAISQIMTPAPSEPPAPGLLAKFPKPAQWAILIAASVAIALVLELAAVPAALLLGPMLAGILVGINGGRIRAPRLPVIGAQSMVGCLVASAITSEIVFTFLKDWPLFIAVVAAVIATSAVLGWMITWMKVLPGTTAIWGVAPGGASAMMLMSADFGADARLVAFMQYLRVVMVAGAASLVARLWVGDVSAAAHAVVWFPPFAWTGLAATLALAGLGGVIGVGLRVPGGTLLVPMIVGAILEGAGLIAITLPPWLLAAGYTLLGWSIGLGFTRDILAHAYRALPQVVLSILILMGVCAVLAFVLVQVAGIDPLTAYLATSPGGMDSVAIIAASSSNVDMSFVMALQGVRLVIVLLAGPPLARFVAQRMTRP